MKECRNEKIKVTGGEIPITLVQEDNGSFTVAIDGVKWLNVENQMHAVVLFTMMQEHITEYMEYQIVK